MKDALLNYVQLVKARHEKVKGNEQATKSSLIDPLFNPPGASAFRLASADRRTETRRPLEGAGQQCGREHACNAPFVPVNPLSRAVRSCPDGSSIFPRQRIAAFTEVDQIEADFKAKVEGEFNKRIDKYIHESVI